MRRSLVLAFSVLLFLHCSKKENSQERSPRATGYFQNTNESWFYETHQVIDTGDAAFSLIRQWTYTVVDRMYHSDLGQEVVTLHEEMVLSYSGDNFTQPPVDTAKRVIYDREKRRLVALNEQNQISEILIDFSDFSIEGPCPTTTWNSTMTKLGKNYYRCYFKSDGDYVVEGLDLGISDCRHFPPVPPYFSAHTQLKEFRYRSNEFSFGWKR